MYNCKFCDLSFEKPNLVAGHIRWCNLNPNRVVRKRKPKGVGCNHFLGKHHSEETKKLLSEKRKAYLAANKDKHNWSRYSNKETVPERKFREFIERTDIKLKQYYIPPESDRFYEMDFAHPESKIAFEINGNQHYNSDGTLKDYYKERQQHFINLGWKITEIHYSLCFKEDVLSSLVKLSFSDFNLCQEKIQEISDHRLERKKQKLLKKQEEQQRFNVDWASSALTKKEIDFHISKRKVERPSKEELHKLLWEMPTTHIAKKFGVSDKAVEKWAKGYCLEKPPRGYWEKLKSNKL